MFVEASSATLTDPSMESSETVFSFRFSIEIFRCHVNGTRAKALEFIERAGIIWMPCWESTLTFVALEKDHICKWFESFLDVFQQSSSEVRANLHCPYRHLAFAADCKLSRESSIVRCRFFTPQKVSFRARITYTLMCCIRIADVLL